MILAVVPGTVGCGNGTAGVAPMPAPPEVALAPGEVADGEVADGEVADGEVADGVAVLALAVVGAVEAPPPLP